MTTTQLEKYRQALLSLRSRLNGDVTHLAGEAFRTSGGETSGSLSNTPLHMADLGTDNFEQEFTLSLLENGEQRLEEIADALHRIDQGTYGACEDCHKPIPAARLEAVPFTRHCVECARKLQRSE
jgi:RNA polymerase-binding protein DksA